MVDQSLIDKVMALKNAGASSVSAQDMINFINLAVAFVNEDSEAQETLKGLSFSIVMDTDGTKNWIKFEEGKASGGEGSSPGATLTLSTDVETAAKIFLGEDEAATLFLKGELEKDGDMTFTIYFIEVLELIQDKTGILKKEERKPMIPLASLKRLFHVYSEGVEAAKEEDIPLFFGVLNAFVNENDEAQDEIDGLEEKRIQMTVRDIGKDFSIKLKDGKMEWIAGTVEDPTLTFAVDMGTAANILLGGDAAAAYLAGKIIASGNLADALILQEIIELFLEVLDLE
jgi:putative sterol carrier protein